MPENLTQKREKSYNQSMDDRIPYDAVVFLRQYFAGDAISEESYGGLERQRDYIGAFVKEMKYCSYGNCQDSETHFPHSQIILACL